MKTVRDYLKSLIIGFDVPTELLERAALSPMEVGLEPLNLDWDLTTHKAEIYDENGNIITGDGNTGEEPDGDSPVTPNPDENTGESGSGNTDGSGSGDENVTPLADEEVPPVDGEVPPTTDGENTPIDTETPPTDGEVPPTDGELPPTEEETPPEEEPVDDLFDVRLDYAASVVYYGMLGMFTGGGYSERIGDISLSKNSFVITKDDRRRYTALGNSLRLKYGFPTIDEYDNMEMFDASRFRS